MSSKMHFLFVVYVCFLQCQLFEFRATDDLHVHQTPHHHHGLRVARSAQPGTVIVTPASSGNSKAKSINNSEIPTTANTTKTNGPIPKSYPVNDAEKNTTVNPTNDKATNTKQENSEVKKIKPDRVSQTNKGKSFENEDDKVATSTTEKDNPSIKKIAATKVKNQEIDFTPSAPISNAKPYKTQVEPEITPMPNKEYDDVLSVQTAYKNPADMTQKLPKTNQQTKQEAEERPMTPTYVLHKSSNVSVTTKNAEKEEISPANVESNKDSAAEQTSPTNRPENVETVPVEKVQCKECSAAHDTKKSQSEMKSGTDKTPVERKSTPKTTSTSEPGL